MERSFSELQDVKHIYESPLFQKFFAEPLHKADKELKHAYDCKNLEELRYVAGLHKGYTFAMDLIQEIETKAKFIKHELDTM